MTSVETFFKKELVKELRIVARLMKEEKNVEKKLYYFSASYGITNRTYRYAFSGEVLLADLILNTAYQTMLERIKMLKSGDPTVTVDENVFNNVQEGLQVLANAFEENKPIQIPLEKILTAAFSISGPGNYLKEKGMLKL